MINLLKNKNFIIEFTKEMNLFRSDFYGEIGNGFYWCNYMIIYSKKT
jgi:hypothetical protein